MYLTSREARVEIKAIDPMADVGQIAAIYAASRRAMHVLPQLPDSRADEHFIARFLRPSMHAVLAYERHKAAAVLIREGCELHLLHTRPESIGRGLGAYLMRFAQMECGELTLGCFSANVKARRFYERHGFVAVSETDGRENSEGLPVTRYVWYAPSVGGTEA
jgi:putative acetyltransferase